MFSATAEYALRALIYLAALPGGEAALGRSIAEHSGVPKNYLSKILHGLKGAGFLDTARGTGGGYRLQRAADDIRLAEVAELFEGSRSNLGCFLGNERECSDERPCSAHARWGPIRTQYIDFMESTTLAELAGGMPPPCETIGAARTKAKRGKTVRPGRRTGPLPSRRGGRR